MADDTGQDGGNPLIVIGDKIQPTPHLVALLQQLRTENNLLNPEDRIQYAVCIEKAVKDKSGMSHDEAVDEVIGQDIFEDLVDVLSRLNISEHLWTLIDFIKFFKLCYLASPKIKSASIPFLQHTA